MRLAGRGEGVVGRRCEWRGRNGTKVEGVDGFREVVRVRLDVGKEGAAGAVDGVGGRLMFGEVGVDRAQQALKRECFLRVAVVDIGEGEGRGYVVDFGDSHATGSAIVVSDEIDGSVGADP